MLKKCHLVVLGCCLSLTTMASTIEFTPDEDIAPVRGGYPTKDWYPTKNWYPTRHSYSEKDYPVKYRHVAPAKVVAPMKAVPPEKIMPPVRVPFPARVAPPVVNKLPWMVVGSAGYANFEQAGDNSGGAMGGRFAIGKGLYNKGNTLFGLELGVQSGNRMSIGASQETLDEMGSLPIWTTVKPMVDLLGTLQVGSDMTSAFFILKGGIVYREWETERQSINNLSQVGGEVQAGIGMAIVKQATLSLLYQGIYGGSNQFTVHADHSANVSNIPVQNGVLLSLSIIL